MRLYYTNMNGQLRCAENNGTLFAFYTHFQWVQGYAKYEYLQNTSPHTENVLTKGSAGKYNRVVTNQVLLQLEETFLVEHCILFTVLVLQSFDICLNKKSAVINSLNICMDYRLQLRAGWEYRVLFTMAGHCIQCPLNLGLLIPEFSTLLEHCVQCPLLFG